MTNDHGRRLWLWWRYVPSSMISINFVIYNHPWEEPVAPNDHPSRYIHDIWVNLPMLIFLSSPRWTWSSLAWASPSSQSLSSTFPLTAVKRWYIYFCQQIFTHILRPGLLVHLHPALLDSVLPPACRDHPTHLPRRPPPWQVCPLHHDPRHIQVWRKCWWLKR